jgi:hypothetical protein
VACIVAAPSEVALAFAVLSLTLPLVVPRFRFLAPAVMAVSSTVLLDSWRLPAIVAAISMVAITSS